MNVVDPLLEQMVERLVRHCLSLKEYKQVIGIAIDTHRLDMLQEVFRQTENLLDSLCYARYATLSYVGRVAYKAKVLSMVAKAASEAAQPDFVFVADCLVAIQDAQGCAHLLVELFKKASDISELCPTILQICFNISADAPQKFVLVVLDAVKKLGDSAFVQRALSVLDGSQATLLKLEFLYRNNKADMLVMEKVKDSLSANNSMHHTLLTCANAIMHCGTTNDEFLRKNMSWLGAATNWAKFTAASSLGTIHKGQGAKGREVLKPYLPANDGSGSPYSEGGAMFALGLINARSELSERDYFMEQLGKTENEVLIHGICLGMGSAAMSSQDKELLDMTKNILYQDNAVTGEAAAIAIGLIFHESGNEEIAAELFQYAHETQHEKSIRGIALAIALIFGGLRERADGFIAKMLADKDSIIRYGGMWVIAMAYAGCSDHGALNRLLHGAVSDASDDVRRAAVASLGFVMCQNSTELPRFIELLSESYNPHVRYGSALALGIAFSGTASSEAISLLKPMCTDFTDFVRQGAYIALAMVMMQHNEASCADSTWFRTTLENVISLKHEDAMAKLGAVLAQGLIDAGGRNSIVSLMSSSGHVNHMAVAGAALFCQLWYWYPLTHFLSFALSPTALIAVDDELRMPKLDVICKAKPSLFANPPPIKTTIAAAPKKFVSAILSTTAKAAAKAKKAAKSTVMDVDSTTPNLSPFPAPQSAMEVDEEEAAEQKKSVSPEPDMFVIGNLSRITPRQRSSIEFPDDSKYAAVCPLWRGEIMVVVDRRPTEVAEYILPSEIKALLETEDNKSKDMIEDDEPAAPKPFEYSETL